MLRYDAFPCPEEASQYLGRGMEPKCFLLNTAFMRQVTANGNTVYFKEKEIGYSGKFIISLPNYCGLADPSFSIPDCVLEAF